ncbi:hypothetical protein FGLOB1_1732 [Fusarium globosum]|uniref:Uncharacterized protein n=1 Tax=Fusarium globosum TaxID=78864 RepID=A0A8H5YTM7_9HYPO|nr:hypothetical protein FGLOB1_1732 [Fusarium globosum]
MAVSEARSDRGHEFPAIALPLPHGTHSNLALYYLHTTCRQVNWPPGFSKPYLDFQMRTLRPSGKIHSFLNGLFTAGYYDKETKTQVPATIAVPNYPGIEVNLYHRPDDTTARTECDAITNINARAEAVNETVVAFTSGFQASLVLTLKENFDGEVQTLVESLKETPYGYAFVTGGPGSGKTTTAMKLVTAIASGDVGETRQHEPKLPVAIESDPVTSNKPESTGWLDVDDDDTCSEASFCSAVPHLAVGPGADKLEQEHIT